MLCESVLVRWHTGTTTTCRQSLLACCYDQTAVITEVPSHDARWPKNTDHVQGFPFTGSVWSVYQYLSNWCTFFLPIWAPLCSALLICSLPVKHKKVDWWHNVHLWHTYWQVFRNHQVTDKDCQTNQNDSASAILFFPFSRNFKYWFFNTSLLFLPFLVIGPMVFLWLGFL